MKNKQILLFLLLIPILLISACSLEKNQNNPSQSNESVKNSNFSKQQNKNIKNSETDYSNQTTKECNAGKMLFQYPSSWGNCTQTKNKVLFEVTKASPKINIILTLDETNIEEYNYFEKKSIKTIGLSDGNGTFFEENPEESLMKGMIYISNNFYKYSFDIDERTSEKQGNEVKKIGYNINKDDLISILKNAKIDYKKLLLEKCGEEPTKISGLKVGDFYNTHKIKEISGNILEKKCENSCSEFPDGLNAKIIFDEEELVSGTLIYTDYVFSLAFAPDDKKWTPRIASSHTSGDNYVFYGLSCTDSFSISNSVGTSTASVFSKLPGIKDFLANAKPGDKYPKKVYITVKNLTSSITIGGEGGTTAEVVNAKLK